MKLKDKRICEIWDEIEDDFPDKSTEWLMAATCERYLLLYEREIDNGDVATALHAEHLESS